MSIFKKYLLSVGLISSVGIAAEIPPRVSGNLSVNTWRDSTTRTLYTDNLELHSNQTDFTLTIRRPNLYFETIVTRHSIDLKSKIVSYSFKREGSSSTHGTTSYSLDSQTAPALECIALIFRHISEIRENMDGAQPNIAEKGRALDDMEYRLKVFVASLTPGDFARSGN